mmetsp:Transcript_111110/g.299656  ORF Transcript_111110/g.299656 Transcript_111110/m.299656 type:complete len:98 (+) Transcript_111110:683-976(+)
MVSLSRPKIWAQNIIKRMLEFWNMVLSEMVMYCNDLLREPISQPWRTPSTAILTISWLEISGKGFEGRKNRFAMHQEQRPVTMLTREVIKNGGSTGG